MDSLDILRQQSSADQIEGVLRAFLDGTTTPTAHLAFVSTLLSHTIQIYPQLPDSCKILLTQVFTSVTGLGNLVMHISLTQDPGHLQSLLTLLSSVARPGLVLKLIQGLQQELKEVDRLLFRGKTLSVVNEAVSKMGIGSFFNSDSCFYSSDTYIEYLVTELLILYRNSTDTRTSNMFLHSLSLFHPSSSNQFFELMFQPQNWHFFTSSFPMMKRFERKAIITKFICTFVPQRFFFNSSQEKMVALAYLLAPVFEAGLVDELFLEKVISACNINLNVLVSILASELPAFVSLVSKQLQYWGNVHLMKSESIAKQESRTHLVIAMLHHCPQDVLRQTLKESTFIDSVSNRLSSHSNGVKSLGVALADQLCDLAGENRIFSMDLTGFELLVDSSSYVRKDNIAISDTQYAWELVEQPVVEDPETEDLVELANFSITERNDSDDESSDEDDPTVGKKEHIPRPLYIKDILEYFSVDSKDPNCYEYQKLALETAPTLLRQKLGFGNEVKFFSKDLVAYTIGLTNSFDDDEFETRRLHVLIAILVSDPDLALELCKLFTAGDYSLQQRMCLLSAVSLAARELKGIQDDIVVKSYDNKQFPSKLLPQNLHNKYMAMEFSDYGLNSIEGNLQNELMAQASEDANDHIAGGKVLRISRKLAKPAPVAVTGTKHPNFSTIIGARFFFPLVHAWYEARGINIGHYSPVLIAHYVKTLSLLVHAAYPEAPALNDMVRELFQIVVPLIKRTQLDELSVIESIVTSVLLILDILQPEYLISHHTADLQLVQQWMSVAWEQIIDSRIKSLCAGLLLRLNELNEKYERLVMDAAGVY